MSKGQMIYEGSSYSTEFRGIIKRLQILNLIGCIRLQTAEPWVTGVLVFVGQTSMKRVRLNASMWPIVYSSASAKRGGITEVTTPRATRCLNGKLL